MLYFNLIHFSFDSETKRIDKDETTIEGPIPVCDKIYDIESALNKYYNTNET